MIFVKFPILLATQPTFHFISMYTGIRTYKYCECCRVWDQLKRRSSCQVISSSRKVGVVRELNHPGFESICVKLCPEAEARGNALQTVLRVGKLVTPLALNQCLQFIYTATISYSSLTDLQVCLVWI